ncbi:SDR family NAD(P)-dependent oxidoreductase, partial [Mesorhizobium sp. M7A.F.Ca.US.001.02.1.1]
MTRPAAIVTGGARGIGLACAQALADAGFDILVADLAETAADGLAP